MTPLNPPKYKLFQKINNNVYFGSLEIKDIFTNIDWSSEYVYRVMNDDMEYFFLTEEELSEYFI